MPHFCYSPYKLKNKYKNDMVKVYKSIVKKAKV